MDFLDLDDAIAALAHRCWCKAMLDAGWRGGKVFDRDAREHDAIRPYEQLTEFKRAQLRQRIGWDEVEPALAKAVVDAHMRPEFSALDIFVGMPVRLWDDTSGDIGRLVAWSLADPKSGMLESLSVEWPSGEVVEYAPNDEFLIAAE